MRIGFGKRSHSMATSCKGSTTFWPNALIGQAATVCFHTTRGPQFENHWNFRRTREQRLREKESQGECMPNTNHRIKTKLEAFKHMRILSRIQWCRMQRVSERERPHSRKHRAMIMRTFSIAFKFSLFSVFRHFVPEHTQRIQLACVYLRAW